MTTRMNNNDLCVNKFFHIGIVELHSFMIISIYFTLDRKIRII